MGFFDRLFGTEPPRRPVSPASPPAYAVAPGQPGAAPTADEQALARYRYLLRTAPPEAIEQVHAEAFAALTPAQRQQLLNELSDQLPVDERPANADPRVMARAATRAEYMHPGFMERNFSSQRSGPGFGTMVGASALGGIIGYVATAAIMAPFIGSDFGYADGYADGLAADGGSAADGSGATDAGTADFGGGDFGGGFGDFGGGDFGGFDI
ncbi:hypothetical protein LK09_13700 [Microbacterium mangrovi]|uniref:Uncharacterized protein n=1 Tax=Microbacterium mangrovi TaxID=1348253 RepID=A0A0B2A554_9MICO|nr:hypothetical protein [Microbacterium mangrovi]KHK96894.1 hypothetical protein LK09_13700 [Microbacterium mangrovi]